MPATIYPATDLDRKDVLLSLLGSFWQNTYGGRFVVESYLQGLALEENQTLSELQEAVDALGRSTVPVFQTDYWRPVRLLESQLSSQMLKYGDGAVYGFDYMYGVPPPLRTFEFPLATEVAYVPRITNSIVSPTRSFTHGVDYVVEPGFLVFNSNPFDDDTLSPTDVYEDGQTVDRELTLWLSGARIDREHIYKHFGYVLRLDLESSTAYRQLVNVIFDSLVQGAAGNKAIGLIAAVTGTPVAASDGEIVEFVGADANGLSIITDQNAYRYSATATALVAVGDVLYSGQQLTDVVTVDELNRGVMPADLFALSVGAGLLPGDFVGPIGFVNSEETLQATVVAGKTRVEFPLLGFPGDVEDFWDRVHSKGLENEDESLATALDIRSKPVPTPTQPFHLPATINPLQFLLENVIRGGATLVRVKADKIVSPVSSIELRWLRQITSPWTTMLVLFELEMPEETVIMDTPGESPGYEDDSVEAFDALDDGGDIIPSAMYVTAGDPTLYIVDGYCL